MRQSLERSLVVVFARAPRAGRAKTRLAPPLSYEEAARLQEAFVRDLVNRLGGAYAVELHTDEPTTAWADLACPKRVQAAGDLGARLLCALEDGLRRGYTSVAVLGSDSPTVPLDYVRELVGSEADVTLGPAEDGGFWGIAARRTHPEMFRNVAWSTSKTCQQTVRAVSAAGLSVALGQAWFDVDEPASLERLLRGPMGPAVQSAVATMGLCGFSCSVAREEWEKPA
jgi:rSAM/selenodomain-associated transferase 1